MHKAQENNHTRVHIRRQEYKVPALCSAHHPFLILSRGAWTQLTPTLQWDSELSHLLIQIS